jgi:hypothetical protein
MIRDHADERASTEVRLHAGQGFETTPSAVCPEWRTRSGVGHHSVP